MRVLCKAGWRLDPVDDVPNHPTVQSDVQESSWNIPVNPSAYLYIADQLVDSYFYHFHTAYPIIHEATFRAQYSEIIPKPSGFSWPLLSKIVQSIGAWCIGDQGTGEASNELLTSNVTSNLDLLGNGSLYVVQALTLLSLHLQRLNRPNIASVLLGSAVRMAMSLGLHKEFPEWKIKPYEREMRRRVWWCLYMFDSGESITLGRPILLPSCSTMDAVRPLNVPDTVRNYVPMLI